MEGGVHESVVAVRPGVELEAAEALETVERAAPYLIVTTQLGTVRRLHRTEGCWRAIAFSFKNFGYCSEDPVPVERYTHYCHDCWPKTAPLVKADKVEESDSSSDSSSSTSG